MEKEDLLPSIEKGKRVRAVLNQSGWKDIEAIFNDCGQRGKETLADPDKDGERHFARGLLQAVDYIKSMIDYAANDGKRAEQEYEEKFTPQSTAGKG